MDFREKSRLEANILKAICFELRKCRENNNGRRKDQVVKGFHLKHVKCILVLRENVYLNLSQIHMPMTN